MSEERAEMFGQIEEVLRMIGSIAHIERSLDEIISLLGWEPKPHATLAGKVSHIRNLARAAKRELDQRREHVRQIQALQKGIRRLNRKLKRGQQDSAPAGGPGDA